MDLKERVAAAQATLDKYKDQPFAPGRFDCGQMVKTHLLRMGKPIKKAAKVGKYHSIAGGVRWLKKLGYDSLIEVMDDHFERIPPAMRWPGDVVALPGEDGPGALTVALTNGRLLGFHADAAGACVMQPDEFVAAWRVA